MEQYSAPTTTADSKSDGRLKVGAGCSHGKKKCLKCAISKHDGKGGSTMPKLNFPIGEGGYGASAAQKNIKPAGSGLPLFSGKKHKSLRVPGGLKPKGGKALKFSLKSTSALFKSMKLGKGPKIPKGMKARSLKAILRGN